MTLGDDASYDVRVWAIRVYKGRRGTSYTVRWQVSGSPHQRTFATRKLAESFRAGLITAARSGVQFFASDGAWGTVRVDVGWPRLFTETPTLTDPSFWASRETSRGESRPRLDR